MIRAMRTAASGMRAQQMNVDNIANNLANVNTTGFKKSRIEFQDLFYEQTRAAATPTATGNAAPTGLEVGYGALPVSTQRMWTQGELQATGNSTDVAIMGDGFFRIQAPDGQDAYTRDGSFKLSPDGLLVTSDGYPLSPEIVLPQDTKDLTIAADGTVSVTLAADSTPQTVGQIELVRFVNPTGLSAQGQNLYKETPNSGQPLPGTPTTEGYGRLQQGHLEVSNVEVIDEMIGLITAQRAYEINSKAIKASDDMMGLTNNLTG